MPIKILEASINVVQAAKERIKNIFSNNVKVYLSFSGGKDSLCLGHLVLSMIQSGEISGENLTVVFIDEEAIFPCIEKTIYDWRKKFLLLGVTFEWFCLEVKHFNCFNELSSDESFICWDSEKSDVWVRQPPAFSVRSHPLLKPRTYTYQDFLWRYYMDGISITGIRTSESLQRLKYIAESTKAGKSITNKNTIYPIYDWNNNDVWLYLRDNNVDIPDVYLYLWQTGASRSKLRVSQFFSVDTAGTLVKMNEYYPDLMERVIRREPNAYLAALYWDSEMFGRRTSKRRELEKNQEKSIDYQVELMKMFGNIPNHFNTPQKQKVAETYRRQFVKSSGFTTDIDYLCKQMYESLIAGDPKMRKIRAIIQDIAEMHAKSAKKEAGLNVK